MGDAAFLVIEGLDGAGTTTQVRLLADALRAAGRSVAETREPSDGPIGVQIRQALRRRLTRSDGERLAPETIALLFAADRIDHLVDEVEPALERGRVVVSDRYVHSSIAYQGAENDVDWVVSINARARVADLVIHLDTPVEECLVRIRSRGGEAELFEHRSFLEAVAQGYEAAYRSRPDPVVRVHGTGSIAAVHAAVVAAVEAHGFGPVRAS
jgi:dTMP kinase